MKILLNKSKLIKFIKNEKNLGFVPTMGGIHQGHLSLVKKSKRQSNKTIVTIFINKPQFNRKIDYQKYPKSLKKDIKILKNSKVDYLYIPTHKQIYPFGPNKKIKINSFGNKLCGKFRPGHFEAIVDVVTKFTNIINPKRIYLGEKDMQQLKIIELFFKKNFKDIKVIGCKTIREKNGIAHSTRNALLSIDQKKIASKVFKFLINKKKKLVKKEISLSIIKNQIYKLGINKIDYVELLDVNKIIKKNTKIKKYRIFIAYYIGTTRLIDNV